MVTIRIDEHECEVRENALLGHVLHELKNANIRKSPRTGAPRGLFCGMGICYECIVTINGRSGIRSCMTRVKPGMKVETDT